MVRKRLTCFLAIFALLFTAVPFAAVSVYAEPDDSGVTDPIPGGNEGEEPGGGEDPEEPSVPTVPILEVIGSTIKNDEDYFELSLKVNPPEKGFFSTGIVLQYDSGVVVPATWGTENTTVDMSDRTDWRNVAALPAIAPKELSGKTAFVYQDKPKTENPDTPDPPTPPDPENPDDNQGGEPAGQAEGEDTEGEDPIQPTEPEEPTAYTSKGYLCLSGEAALPIKTMPEEGRIVTVRFKYVGDDKDAKAANKKRVIEGFSTENGEKIFTLAPDGVAAASHVGQSIVYCPDKDIEDTTLYYTTVNTSADPPEVSEGITTGTLLTKEQAYKLTLEQDVDSSNFGRPDASMFAAIVFYDWDEVTMLGSTTVAKGMDATDTVRAFEDTLKATTFDAGSSFYSSDATKPLTNKKGYTFEGVWLDFNSDLRTHYGVAASGDEIPKPEGVSFNNLSGSIVVKAAYGSNSEIATDDVNYITKILGYNRFGSTSNYSVTIEIKRENIAGAGVPRTGELAVRVAMATEIGDLFSIYTPNNKDVVTVEIAPNANVESLGIEVIDRYGTSNWVGTSARSNVNSDAIRGTAADKNGFVFFGTIKAVNAAVAPGGRTADIVQTMLTVQLGIPLRDAANKNVTIANARTYIRTAWRKKNPGYNDPEPPEFVDLTWDEIKHAIQNKGALMGS